MEMTDYFICERPEAPLGPPGSNFLHPNCEKCKQMLRVLISSGMLDPDKQIQSFWCEDIQSVESYVGVAGWK